jgi:hypothetical protein
LWDFSRGLRPFFPLNCPSVAKGNFGVKKVKAPSKNLKKCLLYILPQTKKIISRTFKIRGTVHWYFYVPERERERERESKSEKGKGKGESERERERERDREREQKCAR